MSYFGEVIDSVSLMRNSSPSCRGGGRGLLDFKLDGGLSTQTFEGVDFSDEAARAKAKEAEGALKLSIVSSMQAALGERTAKRGMTYVEKEIATTLKVDGSGPKKGKSEAAKLREMLPPAHRPPARLDPWLLLDRNRILEICALEIAHIKAARTTATTAATAEAAPAMTDGDADLSTPSGPFPQELIDERARLLSEGFPTWRKADFDSYMKVCTSVDLSDARTIVRDAAKILKRPIAEIQVS